MAKRYCEVRRAANADHGWPDDNRTIEVVVDDYSQIEFKFDAAWKLAAAPVIRPKERLLRFPDGKVHAFLEDTTRRPSSWERIGPLDATTIELKSRAEATATEAIAAKTPSKSPESVRIEGSSRWMVEGVWQWVTWVGPGEGPVSMGFPFRVIVTDDGKVKELRALGY
jgi:hypothetical protein